MANKLPGVIRQQGYVVDDLDDSMERWWRHLGVGPWLAMRNLVLPDVEYRGDLVTIEMSIALANSGDMQIELIHQTGGGPSCYREFLDSGRSGLHHLAWWVDDVDAVRSDAVASGWEVLQAGDMNSVRFCYFDTERAAGVVTEIMELNDMTRWLGEHVRAASAEWDGVTDPVRSLG